MTWLAVLVRFTGYSLLVSFIVHETLVLTLYAGGFGKGLALANFSGNVGMCCVVVFFCGWGVLVMRPLRLTVSYSRASPPKDVLARCAAQASRNAGLAVMPVVLAMFIVVAYHQSFMRAVPLKIASMLTFAYLMWRVSKAATVYMVAGSVVGLALRLLSPAVPAPPKLLILYAVVGIPFLLMSFDLLLGTTMAQWKHLEALRGSSDVAVRQEGRDAASGR